MKFTLIAFLTLHPFGRAWFGAFGCRVARLSVAVRCLSFRTLIKGQKIGYLLAVMACKSVFSRLGAIPYAMTNFFAIEALDLITIGWRRSPLFFAVSTGMAKL